MAAPDGSALNRLVSTSGYGSTVISQVRVTVRSVGNRSSIVKEPSPPRPCSRAGRGALLRSSEVFTLPVQPS